ncbi:MAG: hypothetical protein IKX43_03235 [Paludibacteraceae bacterium]|nr:hypothetical protein [Paludibacteraceae bacterium]
MKYIIIIIVAIIVFLFVKYFTKRKLTFTVLAISFLFSILPCSSVIEFGDGPGDGFIILIIYIFAIFPWLIMMMMIYIKIFNTFYVLSYGFIIIMAIVFGYICFDARLHSSIIYALLLFIVNTAFYILCAYTIEKAKTTPMKIVAVALALASFIVPYGFMGLWIKCI